MGNLDIVFMVIVVVICVLCIVGAALYSLDRNVDPHGPKA